MEYTRTEMPSMPGHINVHHEYGNGLIVSRLYRLSNSLQQLCITQVWAWDEHGSLTRTPVKVPDEEVAAELEQMWVNRVAQEREVDWVGRRY